MNIAIVGSREREISGDKEKEQVDEIINSLLAIHGTRLQVLSVGCDKGIGRYVRDACIKNKIRFAEVRVKFEGEGFDRKFFAQLFTSRNDVVISNSDEFYIFFGPNANGIIEQMADKARAKVSEKRVFVYPQ